MRRERMQGWKRGVRERGRESDGLKWGEREREVEDTERERGERGG
jgi:hypothetical protein